MSSFRKTCISGGTFWGYESYVDIEEITCLDDIINKTISNLKKDLNNLKLVELSKNLDPRVFHIHSIDFMGVLISNTECVIYICNHC